jgi:hypothetical protein
MDALTRASACLYLLILIPITLVSCSEGTESMPRPPTPIPQPEIIWVAEMEPFGQEFSSPAILPSGEIEAFDQAWEGVRANVAVQISPESLITISRWAVTETKGLSLTKGWIAHVPMHPIGLTQDGNQALFSQSTQEGIPLPAHSPIVRRRLVVAAVYDRARHSVPQVYISIRGWAEE